MQQRFSTCNVALRVEDVARITRPLVYMSVLLLNG